MRKSQQSTLFQTWGYHGKQKQHEEKKENNTRSNLTHHRPEKSKGKNDAASSSTTINKNDDAIDLVGFDENDDLDMLECVESVEQNYRHEVNAQTTASANLQQKPSPSSSKKTNGIVGHKINNTLSRIETIQDVYLDNHHCMQRSQETIPGFDASFGTTYIYPTNYPVRDYQFNIIRKAILKNTLVVLPTGLGKTFIAAVVMYNFYRWYPQRKLIFMAPTKPLVAQQIEACHNIMGIPQKDTTEMTGALAPNKRQLLWQSRRVFFMTPQVLQNDLDRGICGALDIVCLVFDEAHKALGNHSYSQVIKEVSKHHSQFRVLALSATPGSDMKAVQEVVNNLLISHVELRSDDSIDIQQYVHNRKVEKIVVPLCEDIKDARKTFLELLQSVVIRLHAKKAIWQNDASKISKFLVLKAREQWRANNACQDRTLMGSIEGDFALLMSLYHALDLLMQHGLLSFYNFLKSVLGGHKGSSRSKQEMWRNPKFMDLMEDLHTKIEGEEGGNQSLNETIIAEKAMTPKQRLLKSIPKTLKSFSSHPKIKKLEEIVVSHFKKFLEKYSGNQPTSSQTPLNTRVMIFSQFRDSVQEITAVLSRHEPLVKVMSFIGQGSKEGTNSKSNRGLSQKEQLEILRRFRTGGYNTVVSTSVGEEGLDIGDVDLIICFDASSSPIRLVQRMGRTGRKRDGRIIILVGEGKEEAVYKRSLSNKKGIHKNLINASKSLELYKEAPRMIPKHLNPKCYKMNITVEKYQSNLKNKATLSSKKKSPSVSTETATTASTTSTKKRKSSTGNVAHERNSIKRFTEKGLLDDNETEYLKNNFQGDRAGCKNCQKFQQEANISSSNSHSRKRYCYHVNIKPLSLSAWLPWQTSTQSTCHSTRTSKFCSVMESAAQLRTSTEVEDYEKWLFSKFKETDVVSDALNNARRGEISTETSSNAKIVKHKNLKTPKKTGKDWRRNLNTNGRTCQIAISDDSDIDDFSEKNYENMINNKGNESDGLDDEKFKPCSLNELLEKQEEKMSAQCKKKFRLTKLPKPPTIDPDVSDISDNQIGFCSQVSMETLYNRCQKKRKRDQLDVLLEVEPEGDENSDVEPRYKKTKFEVDNSDNNNDNGNLSDEEDDFLKEDEMVENAISNTDGQAENEDEKKSNRNLLNIDSDGEDNLFNIFDDSEDEKETKIPEKDEKDFDNSHHQNASRILKEDVDDIFPKDRKDKMVSDTQVLSSMFPMNTTPPKLRKQEECCKAAKTQIKSAANVPISDAIPEAPSEIELSSFLLFDSSFVPNDDGNKNVIKLADEKTCAEPLSPVSGKHRSCDLTNAIIAGKTNEKVIEESNPEVSSSRCETVKIDAASEQERSIDDNISIQNTDIDTELFGNSFNDDYLDVDGIDDDLDSSSPPIVSQRRLPVAKKSEVMRHSFDFQIPGFGETEDEKEPQEQNSDSTIDNKPMRNIENDDKAHGQPVNKFKGYSDDRDGCQDYFQVDNNNKSSSSSSSNNNNNNNNNNKISNNNMKNISHKKHRGIIDVDNIDTADVINNASVDRKDGDDGDSPVFVKPKRALARKKNPLIFQSQTDPQLNLNETKETKSKNDVNKDDNDIDGLLFVKPKISRFSKKKQQVIEESFNSPDSTCIVSPNNIGSSSIRGKNVKSFRQQETINRRNQLQQKRSQAKLFLDTQCEDDDEDACINDCEDSYYDNNQYVLDSFIDDATQPTSASVVHSKNIKGRSPVDMNFIYRQSLMSPSNNQRNGLHFHTPAFKTNRNRYKLANLAEKYNNISHNVSSEAEEIIGVIDSEEEERLSREEELKLKKKKSKNRARQDSDVNSVKESAKVQQKITSVVLKKPGKRIRMIVDSDDEDDFRVNDRNRGGGQKQAEGTGKSWRETYTLEELPTATFSFGINW